MTRKHPPEKPLITVSVGRQPIFDGKNHLWGYAIFCVTNAKEEKLGEAAHPENVAVQVASGTYMGVQQFMQQGKILLVDFNEKSIFNDLPYAFPPNLAAILIHQDLCHNPQIIESIDQLQKDGYLLAIDGFSGDSACSEFYEMADILCVDLSSHSKDRLKALFQSTQPFNAMVLAKNIEEPGMLSFCHDLGFSLFHGSFFKTPEIFTDRQISSTEISRFNLLRILENKDPNIGELAQIIQADVSISFRLLSYLNSAAFGFSQNIQSVHTAITLLGWKQIRKWLRVLILSDMGKGLESPDLIFLSAQRGKLLESIAADHDFWGFNPDSLFLLGTFSLLDTLLGIPMTEIVKHLPVENKIKNALCGESNNEYLPLLQLATGLEEARWEVCEQMIQNLNLDPGRVKIAFQASVDWANELSAFQM